LLLCLIREKVDFDQAGESFAELAYLLERVLHGIGSQHIPHLYDFTQHGRIVFAAIKQVGKVRSLRLFDAQHMGCPTSVPYI